MTEIGHDKNANSGALLQPRRSVQLVEKSRYLFPIGRLEPLDESAADGNETRPANRLLCLPFEAVLDLGQGEPMMLAFRPDGEVGSGEVGIGKTPSVNANH